MQYQMKILFDTLNKFVKILDANGKRGHGIIKVTHAL